MHHRPVHTIEDALELPDFELTMKVDRKTIYSDGKRVAPFLGDHPDENPAERTT